MELSLSAVVTSPPQERVSEAQNPGSLFDPDGATMLFADARAKRVGDIVLIKVVETTLSKSKASTTAAGMGGRLVVRHPVRTSTASMNIIHLFCIFPPGLRHTHRFGVDNTIMSTSLAEARIELYGEGVLADKQRPGWLARILDNVGHGLDRELRAALVPGPRQADHQSVAD